MDAMRWKRGGGEHDEGIPNEAPRRAREETDENVCEHGGDEWAPGRRPGLHPGAWIRRALGGRKKTHAEANSTRKADICARTEEKGGGICADPRLETNAGAIERRVAQKRRKGEGEEGLETIEETRRHRTEGGQSERQYADGRAWREGYLKQTQRAGKRCEEERSGRAREQESMSTHRAGRKLILLSSYPAHTMHLSLSPRLSTWPPTAMTSTRTTQRTSRSRCLYDPDDRGSDDRDERKSVREGWCCCVPRGACASARWLALGSGAGVLALAWHQRWGYKLLPRRGVRVAGTTPCTRSRCSGSEGEEAAQGGAEGGDTDLTPEPGRDDCAGAEGDIGYVCRGQQLRGSETRAAPMSVCAYQTGKISRPGSPSHSPSVSTLATITEFRRVTVHTALAMGRRLADDQNSHHEMKNTNWRIETHIESTEGHFAFQVSAPPPPAFGQGFQTAFAHSNFLLLPFKARRSRIPLFSTSRRRTRNERWSLSREIKPLGLNNNLRRQQRPQATGAATPRFTHLPENNVRGLNDLPLLGVDLRVFSILHTARAEETYSVAAQVRIDSLSAVKNRNSVTPLMEQPVTGRPLGAYALYKAEICSHSILPFSAWDLEMDIDTSSTPKAVSTPGTDNAHGIDSIIADLETILQAAQEAVLLAPEGHPDRPKHLGNLGVAFANRYNRLGDLNDLEAGLKIEQEAVELAPDGHPEKALHLYNLAASFRRRYRRLGDLNDLQAALHANQEAVGLTPEGHPHRAGCIQGLAMAFRDQYKRLGDLNDLEAAFKASQEAVALTPEGNPERVGCLQGLAMSFRDRYQRLNDLADLEAGLQAEQEALKLTPNGHPERLSCLQGLAVSFLSKYRRLGDLNDLEAALKADQEAVRLTPEGHPNRLDCLQNLMVAFTYRYWRLGDLNDLGAALKMGQEVVELTPDGHPEKAHRLHNLAESFRSQYKRLGDLNDLQAALHANQEAVGLTPEGHPHRAGCIRGLARAFRDQYKRLGDLNDLEASLMANREAVALTPEGHPERVGCLQGLAMSFIDRYRRLNDLTDLEAGLQAGQEALKLAPNGHPERPSCLQGLAVSLTERYRRLGDLNDLEAALKADQEAVRLTPEGHPNRLDCLQNLVVAFTYRYKRLGDLNDLEAALKAEQEVVELTPDGHPEKTSRLHKLAESFRSRYKRLGDLNDLQAALCANQEAVELTPEGHPHRAGFIQGLAISFRDQYKRLGDLDDLEASFKANQEAVALTPEGHPERARYLLGLAMSFRDRYQRLGDPTDLEAALQASQEAVRLTPKGNPARPARLVGLAVSFLDRYRRLGDLNDLEAALMATQTAVELTPDGHPEKAHHLHHLAGSFRDRYKRLGDLNDLQAAVHASQAAVGLTSEGHPDKANYIQGVAVLFTDKYRRLRDLNDLEAALQANQEAVELTPKGHPDRPGRLEGLAVSSLDRYLRLGDLNDLEAALKADQEAVRLTPDEHPDRAGRLQNLAVSLTARYRKFSRPEDLDSIHTNYALSFKTLNSSPEASWSAALWWAIVSDEFQSAQAMTAYSNAFQLLPDILWVGNVLPVRHEATYRLDIREATSAAARTFINFSKSVSAVEIIEQGVGITFQQMLQLKTDGNGLPFAQASELKLLSSELYSGTSSNRQDVATKRQKLLGVIRQQPGLEHFLLPKSYKIISHASQGGPVVILNSLQTRCDGIIILDPVSDPVHVSLPNVTVTLLKSQHEILRELLGRSNVRTREESGSTRLFGRHLLTWLYTNVVAPIYEVLELHDIHNGRLWWLPTGAFTALPLHACSPSNQFIHSYTATLGSLLDAYSKKSFNPPKVGVVGVTHTGSGAHLLPGVEQEVKKILSIIKKSPVECLEGPQATPDAVKVQLQNCSWVHLACHGKQDLVEPTKSHLLLYQGVLELETILQMPLSNAEFVFLAACQTAMGDPQLINESFHLGGGFIAAGFKSAIGTLWSMNDQDGPLVAEKVYSHLFREGRQPQARDTAEALQLAVEALKARKVPYERWIPFIHMGI
ncbi:CHAT domain-containing protein [Mycena vulgaris]|nr:CHAT domain-containing protein [Mycena vulgaris]